LHPGLFDQPLAAACSSFTVVQKAFHHEARRTGREGKAKAILDADKI
jgi:hypothetical protein